MIGEHKPQSARGSNPKSAVAALLDETLTALEESCYDLTDEEAAAFPIAGRNNIAWIVMHTLQNLDTYTNWFPTGKGTFAHDERWDLWQCSEEEKPKPGDAFPTVKAMLDILKRLRENAMRALDGMREGDLLELPRHGADFWKGRNQLDAYVRPMGNAHPHIRQIWLLRGALRLTDGKSWPQQHWA